MPAPRFTIARLMIVVAICAGLLALLPLVDQQGGWLVLGIVGAISSGVGGLGWRICRGHPTWAVLGLMIVAAMTVGLVVTIDLHWPYPLFTPEFAITLVILTGPPLLGFTVALGGSVVAMRAAWRRNLALAALVASPIAAESAVVTNWPFHVMFWLSRPALAALAEQADRGGSIRWPVRAGIFLIEGAKVDMNHNGNVLLMTNDNPSDPSGFLRLVEPTDYDQKSRLMTPSNIDLPLDGTWHYQDED